MTVAELESRVAALEAEVATLRRKLEEAEVAARIRRGLSQADEGLTIPARDALEALRKKHGIPAA